MVSCRENCSGASGVTLGRGTSTGPGACCSGLPAADDSVRVPRRPLTASGALEYGPLLTMPFALLQGYTFARTRSLTYVVCVHLLFDVVVFLVLVHAHNRGWLAIFLY